MHTSQNPSTLRFALERLGLLRKRAHFTPQEVRQRLKLDSASDPRTAAVHAAAARSGLWSSLLSRKVEVDLGRAASRLPTVVYWYRQGVSPREIGRRLYLFGSSWDAERALDVAATLIAKALNRSGNVRSVA
jgi:hypothetical protein